MVEIAAVVEQATGSVGTAHPSCLRGGAKVVARGVRWRCRRGRLTRWLSAVPASSVTEGGVVSASKERHYLSRALYGEIVDIKSEPGLSRGALFVLL